MVGVVIAVLVLGFIGWQFIFSARKKKAQKMSNKPFPAEWREILDDEISFYSRLTAEEKTRFERSMLEFLDDIKITGVSTQVEDKDRVMVAAAAIIPVFRLGVSKYPNLTEVLIYPNAFSKDHQVEGHGRNIAGMVGTGYMNGTMILSKQSLRGGFRSARDGQNTAIHEFVHLIDGWDGAIDGIPDVLIDQPAVTPWMMLVQEKTREILKKRSDIDPYGATSQTEFLAVVSEYFFENPERMKKKHPELYKALEEAFIKH
ncbi:zinc-dependent peptidase [Sanyastnella coralliicola]|uniref:M90 family metallopeptidase n=1 Tax=Sanyastnella coralliicola TaxID=3069118 RepID=UPI0027BAB583|nr:M90 family metallopeptidase [Longitalea sp. SCSIO 12813]